MGGPRDHHQPADSSDEAGSWHVLVDRHDFRSVRAVAATTEELADGQVRVRVDAFGLTANNVTYAAVGEQIGYWNFFPAPDLGDGRSWGRVPVWGFADVVESRSAAVPEGDRWFGYFPMSTELVVTPTRVSASALVDGSPHRAALPVVYNQYRRCSGDPGYSPGLEAEQMIYWPLFFTSFLIDDFLADHDMFGADAVVLASASSKTAFGTAFLLRSRPGVRVIGLTSPSNVEFVESLGCYDEVVSYDDIEALPDGRTAFVDMSGSHDVIRRVHERYGDDLTRSTIVGVTHWEERTPTAPIPGPPPTMFFAPSRIEQRRDDWGPGGLDERLAGAWAPFVEFVTGQVTMEHRHGADAVVDAFTDLVDNRTSPDVAHVLHP